MVAVFNQQGNIGGRSNERVTKIDRPQHYKNKIFKYTIMRSTTINNNLSNRKKILTKIEVIKDKIAVEVDKGHVEVDKGHLNTERIQTLLNVKKFIFMVRTQIKNKRKPNT